MSKKIKKVQELHDNKVYKTLYPEKNKASDDWVWHHTPEDPKKVINIVKKRLKGNDGIGYEQSSQDKIAEVCDNLKMFLIEKNIRYGNSALEPLRIYSKLNSDEQIKIRMDDKASRIRNTKEGEQIRKNDLVDEIGYRILLCINYGYLDFNDLID